MANTFDNHKPAKNNKCFGVEVECLLPVREWLDNQDRIVGEIYYGEDYSVRRTRTHLGAELVTQPLSYAGVRRVLKNLKKRHPRARHNGSCGIHVHVGRGICGIHRAREIARELGKLSADEMRALFGRKPNDFCDNHGEVGYHAALHNHLDKGTIEFRMFSSGSFEWAAECVRRVRILCRMTKPRTYANIKKAFGIKGD